jgi:hypothetical protein
MKIELLEVVGCRRSMRLGETTDALHMEVDRDASWIDANNGWQIFERAKGKIPSMSMRKLHKEMLQNLKHELKFSRFRRRGPEGVIDCECIFICTDLPCSPGQPELTRFT